MHRNVLVHPHVLKNKPFTFQRTESFVVILVAFSLIYLNVFHIVQAVWFLLFPDCVPLLTRVFRFLRRGKRESWGKSSLKREDDALSHLEQCLWVKSNSLRLPDSQHVACEAPNMRGTVYPEQLLVLYHRVCKHITSWLEIFGWGEERLFATLKHAQ